MDILKEANIKKSIYIIKSITHVGTLADANVRK
jgi:hypothetical protein